MKVVVSLCVCVCVYGGVGMGVDGGKLVYGTSLLDRLHKTWGYVVLGLYVRRKEGRRKREGGNQKVDDEEVFRHNPA